MRGKRGMKKSAAVAASIFAFVSLGFGLLGMLATLIQYSQFGIKLGAGLYVSYGLTIMTTVISPLKISLPASFVLKTACRWI